MAVFNYTKYAGQIYEPAWNVWHIQIKDLAKVGTSAGTYFTAKFRESLYGLRALCKVEVASNPYTGNIAIGMRNNSDYNLLDSDFTATGLLKVESPFDECDMRVEHKDTSGNPSMYLRIDSDISTDDVGKAIIAAEWITRRKADSSFTTLKEEVYEDGEEF